MICNGKTMPEELVARGRRIIEEKPDIRFSELREQLWEAASNDLAWDDVNIMAQRLSAERNRTRQRDAGEELFVKQGELGYAWRRRKKK